MRTVTVLLLFGTGSYAGALELLEISTDHQRGAFSIEARMILDASPVEVWTLLLDLDGFERIDRAVVISHVVGTDDDGNPIAHQRFCGCVAFLCKRIDKTDVYLILGNYRMEATSVEGVSNLDASYQTWQLTEMPNGRTEMAFRWVLDPAFWVPPLIGTYAMMRSLEYVVPRMGSNLEYWAAVDAGREPGSPPPWPAREQCRAVGDDGHSVSSP